MIQVNLNCGKLRNGKSKNVIILLFLTLVVIG